MQRIKCDICEKLVLPSNLLRHQQSKACRARAAANRMLTRQQELVGRIASGLEREGYENLSQVVRAKPSNGIVLMSAVLLLVDDTDLAYADTHIMYQVAAEAAEIDEAAMRGLGRELWVRWPKEAPPLPSVVAWLWAKLGEIHMTVPKWKPDGTVTVMAVPPVFYAQDEILVSRLARYVLGRTRAEIWAEVTAFAMSRAPEATPR